MPSTYTVNLGIEKPATGEQSGTWGDTTNVNFDILDQAINGAERVTLSSAGSSGSPNALIITNGAASDGRNKWIEFYSSGDLGGDVFVQLQPNDAEKIVFIRNSLAGSQSVLLFQGTYNSGRDLEIPAGVDMVVKFDGGGASAANVTDVYNNLKVTGLVAGTADINGGTVDGTVIGGASAAALTATTVVANTSLNIAGDGATVTGIKDEDNMASNSATKLATQQSIKAYVDSQVGTVDTLSEILANGNTTGANDIDVDAAQKVQFRDAAIYINSSVDGQLDIVADTEIQIAATTIDINGAINASGEIIAASLDISGNVDVDGITNLDVVDIDGAVQIDAALTVGVDDTGYDVKFYGATGGAYMLWDESADDLILAGAGGLVVAGNVDFNGDLDVDGTTNLDVVDIDGAVDMARLNSGIV
jgi:cytoskeletal protein CcmA (bactofilin family)